MQKIISKEKIPETCYNSVIIKLREEFKFQEFMQLWQLLTKVKFSDWNRHCGIPESNKKISSYTDRLTMDIFIYDSKNILNECDIDLQR